MQYVRSRMQFFRRMRKRIGSAKVSKVNMGLDEFRLAIQKGYQVLYIMEVYEMQFAHLRGRSVCGLY